MRSLLLAILLINSTISISSQILLDNKEGMKYYDQGTLQLQNGSFICADSLLTLALCTYKNGDVYFNRALARISISDSIGYCEDLKISANRYFDKEAMKLYNTNCCNKVDTVFLDKKMNPIKEKSDYYEEIQYPKFCGQINGRIRKRGIDNEVVCADFSCERKLIGVNFKRTDLIGAYEMYDSIKYFYFIKNGPEHKHKSIYEKIKSKHLQYYKVKFDDLKQTYSIDKIEIVFSFYINKLGIPKGLKQVVTNPIISDEDLKNIKVEIQDFILKLPEYKPAKLGKNSVNSIAYDYIEI